VNAGKVWGATALLLAAAGGAHAGEDQVAVPGPGAYARSASAAAPASRAAASATTPRPAASASARAAAAARPAVAASSPVGSQPPKLLTRPNEYAPEAARQAVRSTSEQIEERNFIRQAAVTARFELEASKLAMTKAQSPAVRAFAADLYRQQEAASVELVRVLHSKSMAMPMMENTQRKTLNRLVRSTGTRFDREYIEAVALRQQREKVQAYERAAGGLNPDPTVRGWVERQLPKAREQMAAAERLATPATPSAPTAHKAVQRTAVPTALAR
jgi:putative membrane protein